MKKERGRKVAFLLLNVPFARTAWSRAALNIALSLEQAALRHPNRPGVTQGDVSWTMAEFADRVRKSATGLRSLPGVVDGDRVAIAMENCPEFLQILYASWHAGLVAVPINAKLHAREIAFILQDSGARLCIASPKIAAAMRDADTLEEAQQGDGEKNGYRAAIIATDSEAFGRLAEASPSPCAALSPHTLAWLFYTSGTTGRPKGAMLSHRNLTFMCHSHFADFDFVDDQDTMLHAAPLSHGAGLYALPHIAKGSHQVITPSGRFEPEEVFTAFEQYDQVSMFAAPTMVTRLISATDAVSASTRGLKTIVYGGGPMYVADMQKAIALFGPKFAQLYGQGESPMTITGLPKSVHGQTTHPLYIPRLGSCGFARFGVEVAIADRDGNHLGPDEVGEVITRSDCVMLGYWNNPEATARSIRNGWLFTGDMGSMDRWGYLTLKDRSKDLIISGGSNIYPREVEEILLIHSGVREVAVVGAPDPDWGEVVIAFVVANCRVDGLEEELDRLCLDHIARFKRPKTYRFVPELPKNNYGKVLKTELRAQLNEAQPVP